MPLGFLLDEHLRRRLWRAIASHNAAGLDLLDVARVGNPVDLPLGSIDPTILVWAERENRILISRDKRTLPVHLVNHLNAGRHSPGIFIIRPGSTVPQLIAFLVLAACCSDSADWLDRIEFIP